MESEKKFTTKSQERETKKKKNVNDSSSQNCENESDRIIMSCPVDVVRLSNITKLLMGEWADSQTINCYFLPSAQAISLCLHYEQL